MAGIAREDTAKAASVTPHGDDTPRGDSASPAGDGPAPAAVPSPAGETAPARRITAARVAAVVAAVLSPALVVASLVLHAGLPPEWRPELPATPEDGAGLTFPAVGAFLVFHRPRFAMAWMMIAGGLAGALATFSSALMLRLALDGDLVTATYLRIGVRVGWALCGLLLATLLPLLSPDGRLPSRRWRPVAVLCSLPILAEMTRSLLRPRPAGTTGPAVVPNPLEVAALGPYDAVIQQWAWAGIYAGIVVGLASLVARFRRAGPEERRQIGWPLLAFTGYVVFLLLGPDMWHIATIWTALIPVAIAFAVTRYRLYGIDTVISRTFVAAGLLVVTGSVYFAAGAVSSLLVAEYHQVAGLVTALFAGASFQPLRRRLQALVDRALYGEAGDPRRLAERLTQELRRAGPAEALASVVAALRDGLSVTGAAIEVADGRPTYAESGRIGPAPRRLPLTWHGERVGTLLLGPPGPRRFSAAHGERLLATLVPYAADVAHAVRIASDLQRSRERILGAREEERRRLRRDLHDGLGRSLTAMAMTINMARLTLTRSPAAADQLLAELRGGMDAVAEDVRELVYGLRPPALDELGLEGAVRALAAEAPPETAVEVRGDLTGLPAAVEVAVYRIVQEALTNVRRHADATAARVELAGADAGPSGSPHRVLRLRVSDDGRGIPPGRRAGVGLASMRERAAELGGTCAVGPGETGGTVVEATIPCD